jgi:hypothetical protein
MQKLKVSNWTLENKTTTPLPESDNRYNNSGCKIQPDKEFRGFDFSSNANKKIIL